jgi:hypothetical protein
MPSMMGYQRVTVQPKLWKRGRQPRMASWLMQIEPAAELGDVGDEVAVGEDDALGVAGGAAGEEQDCLAVTALFVDAEAGWRAGR